MTIVDLIKLKFGDWRTNVMRYVAATEGEIGDRLRQIWCQLCIGDYKHWVCNLRKEAEANGWPKLKQIPQPKIEILGYVGS